MQVDPTKSGMHQLVSPEFDAKHSYQSDLPMAQDYSTKRVAKSIVHVYIYLYKNIISYKFI